MVEEEVDGEEEVVLIVVELEVILKLLADIFLFVCKCM